GRRAGFFGDFENRVVAETVFSARLERDFAFAGTFGLEYSAVGKRGANRAAIAPGAFFGGDSGQLFQQRVRAIGIAAFDPARREYSGRAAERIDFDSRIVGEGR